MIAERGMCTVSGKGTVATIETFHVWWVKHNTVDLAVTIWELATVGTRLNVCRKKLVFPFGDVLPKYALTKSHVSNLRTAWDVESQDMRKNFAVARRVSRKNKFRRRTAVGGFSLCSHTSHSMIFLTCTQAFFSWPPWLFLSRFRIPLQFRLLDQVVPPILFRLESPFQDELTYPCGGHSQELSSALGCVKLAHALKFTSYGSGREGKTVVNKPLNLTGPSRAAVPGKLSATLSLSA